MHWYFLQEMHFLVIILCTELLRLIQLEPLNLETLFKLCCVGLVKDTYAMSSFFLSLFFPSSTILSFFPFFFPSFTLLSFLLPFLTFAFHALVFPSGNAFSSS